MTESFLARVMRGLQLDMRMGRGGHALPLVALVGAVCASLIVQYTLAAAQDIDASGFTFADNLALVFAGDIPYTFRPGVMFVPPLDWLVVVLLILYLPLSYPYRDMLGMGQQVMIREGSRLVWWLAKCLWVLGTVARALLLVGLTTLLWTVARGQDVTLVTHSAAAMLAGAWPVREGAALSAPFLAGVVTTMLALALVQLACALAFSASAAFMGSVALLIVSAYAQHPLLVGNYLMLARWGLMVPGGVDAPTGMLIACAASLAAICGGALVLRRRDMAQRRSMV